VTGTDNVFDRVDTGLELWGAGVSIRRSDVTNYWMAFNGFGLSDGDLSCNWWGTPAGPQNMEWYLHPGVYTPWAAEPIANRSTVSCE
jgi:hypothetical protein